jgi:excisionase family DNA binding protein
MEERYLSLSEAADTLNISERTAYRWIKSGKLRAYKPGRDYWIPESAIREVVEESEVRPKLQAPSSQEKLFNNGVPDKDRRPTDITVRMGAAELSAEGKPLTITVKREQVLRVLHEQGMSAEKADATWRELERLSA